ncbi:hypothetical protein [Ruegeria conchae]|uniref:hypothetical protein n=1 Tax=Ruegeria conchae TaxID=981384 RepID=UPI0029C796BF|nr:hypothetical protein [Ruegeria conchae]
MLRTKALRSIIDTAPIYKMSLGKSAAYEEEALERGALLFQTEAQLYDAVVAGDQAQIATAGALVKSENYPDAGAPPNAWGVWAANIRTFLDLEADSLILHWEAKRDQLYWGVIDQYPIEYLRDEESMQGQAGYFFERKLKDGWQSTSIHDVPLSNIHPKARNLAINMATINLVQTDADFFRAVLADEPIDEWTDRQDWKEAAQKSGWHPKPVAHLKKLYRERIVTPTVRKVADDFEQEVKRMAGTAMKTVQYANGQSVLTTVKEKNTDLTREELEEEIGRLFVGQEFQCALTRYDFRKKTENKHLFPSLDRIDSSLGYISGNLQIVTRAANFYKSASDAEDWAEKALALEKMAIAIQKYRKAHK